MLKVENLKVSYSGIQALRGISLEVEKGQTVALVGPNGAGKSSLLNALSGLVPVEAGEMRLSGTDLTNANPWTVTREGMLQVPEGRQVFADMTVLDNLLIGRNALHRRAERFDLDAVFSLFGILKERQSQLAGSLSGGQQQMLVIGRALMGAPEVLLLDEPSLGLAPVIIEQVFEALKELKKQGITILLVEQNAHLALASSDHAYVLEQGRIVRSGPSAELAADPKIAALYLGN